MKDKLKKDILSPLMIMSQLKTERGIVHIAPAFGEDDALVGKKYGIDFVQLVDKYGQMSSETDFAGMFVKEADKPIIEKLQKEGKMFKVQRLNTHIHIVGAAKARCYIMLKMLGLSKIDIRIGQIGGKQSTNQLDP